MAVTTMRRSVEGRVSRAMIFAMLILLGALSVIEAAPTALSHQRTLRLCSRSLSEALRLICVNRGYNEPFFYSGEEDRRIPDGPGLVEECCYHWCSVEQLDKYCKASSEEKRGDSADIIEESPTIVNLPHSVRREPYPVETSQLTGIDCADGTLKRKQHRCAKRVRKDGRDDFVVDSVDSEGDDDSRDGRIGISHVKRRKKISGRHCRRRRRRCRCFGKGASSLRLDKSNLRGRCRKEGGGSTNPTD